MYLRIQKDPELMSPFELTADRRTTLREIIRQEVSDGLSVRHPQEACWMEADVRYYGQRGKMRRRPIEIPETELTIGAVSVDTIAAQIYDIIWQPSPPVVVRPYDSRWQQHSEDMQDFANRIAFTDLNLKAVSYDAIMQDVMYGTAILYTPWIETSRETGTRNVFRRGPQAFVQALEDVIVPGGADSTEDSRWLAIRMWLTANALKARSQERGWDVSQVKPAGGVSRVRTNRERLAGTQSGFTRRGDLFQIGVVFGSFDVDQDANDKDLLVYYDMTDGAILDAAWNPYEISPVNKMAYQMRSKLFYGYGVMDMAIPYQVSISDFFMEWIINAKLANTRLFKGPSGALPGDSLHIWPGRYVGLAEPDKFDAIQMADTYNSIPAAIQMLLSFAERRIGINEVNTPRPGAVLGNRTPGITALTLMQQVNRRFTPAFDSAKNAVAGCVVQALYRYHERVRANDGQAMELIFKSMGEDRGARIIEILREPDFEQQFNLQLQASSATANVLQERQDWIALAGLLGTYWDRVTQYQQLASAPGVPEKMRESAVKIGAAMAEAVERLVRKFDQVRDVETFIVEVEQETSAATGIPGTTLAPLQQLLGLNGVAGDAGGGIQSFGA